MQLSNSHFCLRVTLSENRFPLFGVTRASSPEFFVEAPGSPVVPLSLEKEGVERREPTPLPAFRVRCARLVPPPFQSSTFSVISGATRTAQ